MGLTRLLPFVNSQSRKAGANTPGKERSRLLDKLERALGYQFADPARLNLAFIHRSYHHEKPDAEADNEQLEFLGDAVIDLVIRARILKTLPTLSEGELTEVRSTVASSRCLAKIARRLRLGKYLLLGKGEEQSGGRSKESLLANAFEALAGAIYLDSDFAHAYAVLEPLLKREIQQAARHDQQEQYKNKAQHLAQQRLGRQPSYRLVDESGPDHDKTFEIEMVIGGKVFGKGKGKNKKEAAQQAAKAAYKKLLRMK